MEPLDPLFAELVAPVEQVYKALLVKVLLLLAIAEVPQLPFNL